MVVLTVFLGLMTCALAASAIRKVDASAVPSGNSSDHGSETANELGCMVSTTTATTTDEQASPTVDLPTPRH